MKQKMSEVRLWDGVIDVYVRGLPVPIECAGEVVYDPDMKYEDAYQTIDAMTRDGRRCILHQDWAGFHKIVLRRTYNETD